MNPITSPESQSVGRSLCPIGSLSRSPGSGIDPATRLEAFSFSMLTVNADDHPVMRRFQRPGDEKRTIVIVPAERYDDWLEAEPGDAPEFLQVYPAEKMVAEAAPRVAASK